MAKKAEFSVEEPIANSSVLVLPRNTAPAARSRVTTVAMVVTWALVLLIGIAVKVLAG